MTNTDNPIMAPVHPGEMLMEDFLGHWESARAGWPKRLAFQPAVSMRSCMDVGGLALTLHCDFLGTSA